MEGGNHRSAPKTSLVSFISITSRKAYDEIYRFMIRCSPGLSEYIWYPQVWVTPICALQIHLNWPESENIKDKVWRRYTSGNKVFNF